jgi:RNA polymerase sigma-70 factor (sigma-E family)
VERAATVPEVGVTEADAEFCAYVGARQPALLRTAYLLTGDRHAAEDLLQTALTRTYLHWRRIRDGNAIDAYVRKVMVNERTSWWRRRLHHESATETVPERAAPQSTSTYDERDEMWMLVSGLPPRQRAAVVLRYYEDLPEADVARILGCSVGTVKSQTSRAVATMRQRLLAGQTGGRTVHSSDGGQR